MTEEKKKGTPTEPDPFEPPPPPNDPPKADEPDKPPPPDDPPKTDEPDKAIPPDEPPKAPMSSQGGGSSKLKGPGIVLLLGVIAFFFLALSMWQCDDKKKLMRQTSTAQSDLTAARSDLTEARRQQELSLARIEADTKKIDGLNGQNSVLLNDLAKCRSKCPWLFAGYRPGPKRLHTTKVAKSTLAPADDGRITSLEQRTGTLETRTGALEQKVDGHIGDESAHFVGDEKTKFQKLLKLQRLNE